MTTLTVPYCAIIPAAGSGRRSGRSEPKQFVEIVGESILRHTLRIFAEDASCVQIIVPIDAVWRAYGEAAARGFETVGFVDGGAVRQESIANALEACADHLDIVVVHDAVRPLATRRLIASVVDAADRDGAAIPALPIDETIKRVREGRVVETVPRDELYTAQTPQAFRKELLRRAYMAASESGTVGTDDASLIEMVGATVTIVPGEYSNIKITWPDDFERAASLLASQSDE